eukprot:m.90482 g.90482  ORF g.90482 m.90482 type:complete len:136 (+) comp12303_c0_seq11:2883-3290(+)
MLGRRSDHRHQRERFGSCLIQRGDGLAYVDELPNMKLEEGVQHARAQVQQTHPLKKMTTVCGSAWCCQLLEEEVVSAQTSYHCTEETQAIQDEGLEAFVYDSYLLHAVCMYVTCGCLMFYRDHAGILTKGLACPL